MTFNLSSQNFTATLIMRIRSFLAFVISICITFAFVPVKTFAFSERGNAQFTDVVNTGKANDCPTLDSSLVGSISLGNGDSLKGICMHPTEVYVKVPGTKRKAAEFVSTKIISPRNNTTVTEVYGDIDSGTFTEKGGIDFQLITVLTPGGLEVPFAFSAKDLTADLPSSIEPGTEVSGSTFTPNYRTGDFLDPKARAKNTGHWTWWDYRNKAYEFNKGWRIDHIYISKELSSKLKSCVIDLQNLFLQKLLVLEITPQ